MGILRQFGEYLFIKKRDPNQNPQHRVTFYPHQNYAYPHYKTIITLITFQQLEH